VGVARWPGQAPVWHTFDAPNAASLIYKATGNLRAIQILLGHTNIEHTVRYLGVDVDGALTLSERTEL
jgi:site-specific recombinase XerC